MNDTITNFTFTSNFSSTTIVKTFSEADIIKNYCQELSGSIVKLSVYLIVLLIVKEVLARLMVKRPNLVRYHSIVSAALDIILFTLLLTIIIVQVFY